MRGVSMTVPTEPGPHNHDIVKIDRTWWEELVNGTQTIGMPWEGSNGFVRQMANPRVAERPWTPAQATRTVAEWFGSDHIVALDPGPRYP